MVPRLRPKPNRDFKSIDDVFDAACIPILITYDSSVLKAHSKTSQQYLDEVSAEAEGVRLRLENKLAALNRAIELAQEAS